MQMIPEMTDIVIIKEFSYNNKDGGTTLSQSKRFPSLVDAPFEKKATVKVIRCWHDYETGWRYIAVPYNDPALVTYLEQNSRSQRIYFSQFDVTRGVGREQLNISDIKELNKLDQEIREIESLVRKHSVR